MKQEILTSYDNFYRFGFDLGTSSLGVAVYKTDEKGNILSLEHLDSYIFGEPVEPKKMETLNTSRRSARLIRRQIERKAARVRKLTYMAEQLGITKQDLEQDKEDVIFLRAKAVQEKISLPQLMKVFSHIVKNRGYKGFLSKEEQGKIGKKIKKTNTLLGEDKTLGQLLWKQKQKADKGQPWRKIEEDGTFVYRAAIEKEFEKIWAQQSKHHPQLNTSYKVWGENMFPDFPNQKEIALHDAFYSAMFYQRPIKWELETVGNCSIFPQEKRASCAQNAYQLYRMVKEISNLRWAEKGESETHPLTLAQKANLFEHIRTATSDYSSETLCFPFKKIYSLLNLPQTARFTADRRNGAKEGIKGNTTTYAFEKIGFLNEWSNLTDKVQELVIEFFANITTLTDISDNTNSYITERFNALTKNIFSSPEERKQGTDFVLCLKEKDCLENLEFTSGRAAYGVKALTMLTERILQGEEEADIIQEFADHNPRPSGKLRSVEAIKAQEAINDPVMLRALTEFRKSLTYLINRYGQPSEMVVELTREMKNSLSRRRFLESQNKIQAEERQKAIKELKENKKLLTPRNIEKYLLWLEQEKTCPYSGNPISFEQAFDEHQTQVDHIIPQRGDISGPNVFENKVLAFTDKNKDKSNRLPYEWIFKEDIDDYREFSKEIKEKKKKGETQDFSFGKHSPLINFVQHLWLLYSKEKKGYFCQRERKWKPSQKGARILRKIKNLLMIPSELKDDFNNRQKQQTAWISDIVLAWSKDVCPKVTPTFGELTAYLRSHLQFDKVLPNIRLEEGKELLDKDNKSIDPNKWKELFSNESLSYHNLKELKEDFEVFSSSLEEEPVTEKDKKKAFAKFCAEQKTLLKFNKRCDHRHHAVDAAVIGLCNLSLLQRAEKHHRDFGTLHKIEYIDDNGNHIHEKDIAGFMLDNIPQYAKICQEVQKRLTNYVVWHKPDHYPSGAFFDETAYNVVKDKTGVERFVKRAELSSFLKANEKKTIENLEKLLFTDTIKEEILRQFKERIAQGMTQEEALCGKKDDPLDGIYYRGNKVKKVKYMYLVGRGVREFDENSDKKVISKDKSGNQHCKGYQNYGYACMDFDAKTGKRVALIPLWKYQQQKQIPEGIVRIFAGDILFDKENKQFYKVQKFSSRDGIGISSVTETQGNVVYVSAIKNYVLVSSREDIAKLKNG